jgi:hypothetical protein
MNATMKPATSDQAKLAGIATQLDALADTPALVPEARDAARDAALMVRSLLRATIGLDGRLHSGMENIEAVIATVRQVCRGSQQ